MPDPQALRLGVGWVYSLGRPYRYGGNWNLVLHERSNGIRPFELHIETLSWIFKKKKPHASFDPYTAREEAEDHTTSHSGHVETAMRLLSGKRLASSAMRIIRMIRMVYSGTVQGDLGKPLNTLPFLRPLRTTNGHFPMWPQKCLSDFPYSQIHPQNPALTTMLIPSRPPARGTHVNLGDH